MILNTLKAMVVITTVQLLGCSGDSSPKEVTTPPPIVIAPAPKVTINWQTLTLNGGLISTVVALGNNIILTSLDGDLYRTSDDGQNWQALGVRGHKIFRNNIGDLITDWKYRSIDTGVSWQTLNFDPIPIFFSNYSQQLYGYQSNDTTKEIFVSNDFGDSWLKYADFPPNVNSLLALVADENGNLTGSFLGGSVASRIWSFDAVLKQWSETEIMGAAQSLFMGTDGRVFISTLNGFYRQATFRSNWIELSTITEPNGSHKTPRLLGTDSQGTLWASWGNRLYQVDDSGLTPEVARINLGYQFNGQLALDGDNALLASNNGIWKFNPSLLSIQSSDFTQIGLPEVNVSKLFMVAGELHVSINAGLGEAYLAKYSDTVGDWKHQNFWSEQVEDLKIIDNGEQLAATSWALEGGLGWLYRIDSNRNQYSLLPASKTPVVKAVDISVEGIYTIATGSDSEGDWDDKILQSIDLGTSWQDITSNLISYTPVYDVVSLANGDLLVTTEKGIHFKPSNSENWILKGAANKIIKKLSKTAGGDLVAAGIGVYRSTDNGNSWQDISYDLPQQNITDFSIDSQGAIWISSSQGVFMLPKEKNQWSDANSQLTNTELTSLVINATDQIIIGQQDGNVLRGTVISQ